MPFDPPLPIADSALLIVDVQDSFKFETQRWAERSNHQLEQNVGRLLTAYRAARLPVIFVLHTDPDPGFEPQGPHTRLMEFLDRRAEEPIVHKTTRNSFTSTDLGERLARLGVRRLVIGGIQTEQCVETTTRVAGDLGYDVDFVTEATLTFPIRHRVDGVELDVQSPQAIVRATEFALRGRFARITTVDQIVAEVGKVSAAGA
jgi:nicotinamidase-related amidase